MSCPGSPYPQHYPCCRTLAEREAQPTLVSRTREAVLAHAVGSALGTGGWVSRMRAWLSWCTAVSESENWSAEMADLHKLTASSVAGLQYAAIERVNRRLWVVTPPPPCKASALDPPPSPPCGTHLPGLKPGTAPIIAEGICGGAPYAGGTCCGTGRAWRC